MSVVNFGSSTTLKGFADLIAAVGSEVTVIGQGEPGIGKSSMLKVLADRFPDHEVAYIDCTLLDLGDFALPYTEDSNGLRITKFAPNARFKLHAGKPVIVMLDEIGKAIKSVKNVLLTLMLEQRIGDHYLPKGSIVFGTTNLSSDGVGDTFEVHAKNRVCFITVDKPTDGFMPDGSVEDGSWGQWAINNNIAPEVIAWVKQFPQCLASYRDETQRDNPYIFNPTRAGQGAFVTPRSLEKASHISRQRSVLGSALTISALAGTIGEAAARDMQAFFTVVDKLPSWEMIIKHPDSAMLPDDAVARCILVFSALSKVDKESMPDWMRYMKRLDPEWQALFAKSIVKSNKQAMAISNTAFRDWAMANQYLF